MMGTYLYAMTAVGHRVDLGRIGLPDGWTQVVTLPEKGIAAAVSEYRGPALGGLPRAELLRYLAIHQRVIERAMVEGPVLPIKFGTILASNHEVRAVLDRWHDRLTTALSQMGGSVEIEVAATWDISQTFAEIGCLPQIAALAATIAGRPAEEMTEVRVHIGQMVKEALDQRREEYGQRVTQELLSFARDSQPNALLSDELVVNVAFLVERTHLEAFNACVHRLDVLFEGRLNFRCVGPLPPYSFAIVDIVRSRRDQLEPACRLLELGERISEAELTNNYRRLAARYHPDRNPDDAGAVERFAALAAAHAQLLAYLRGQRTGDGEAEKDHWYDLGQMGPDGAPLLTIRRSELPSMPYLEVRRERAAVAI